ncbi:hypothetical protein LRD69_14005 [Streptomyces sp. JH14]|uniref:hypothetical protein n=1 Tax=Streptomyces sp. JH14 TaxID=2793630 RepID=UPI0023F739D6|nr:hypothetical protein [Streptomyces sp. JH14]MDF6043242.1 hypothetical protein [Streptomyces sp. JH14]
MIMIIRRTAGEVAARSAGFRASDDLGPLINDHASLSRNVTALSSRNAAQLE